MEIEEERKEIVQNDVANDLSINYFKKPSMIQKQRNWKHFINHKTMKTKKVQLDKFVIIAVLLRIPLKSSHSIYHLHQEQLEVNINN